MLGEDFYQKGSQQEASVRAFVGVAQGGPKSSFAK
jgi:hypothetical protein